MKEGLDEIIRRPAWLLPHVGGARNALPPAGLRSFIRRLMGGENLLRGESADLVEALLDGSATEAQIAAALVALAVKGETVEELCGMATAMRSRATFIRSKHECFIDTAGTGSSSAKTFNVSTAAAFVIAASGLPVAKHGNRGASSVSGSADVLTQLGVNVSPSPEISEKCLNEIGMCFMFAPLYHASTARVAAVRRDLGVHTTFNLLGPLTNPARAPRQLIGVWHKELLRPMAHALLELGTERSWVIHGADGLDEVTIADKSLVAEVRDGQVSTIEVGPEDFGLERASINHLRGGDAALNAEIIRDVLDGSRREGARALVVVNAAAALYIGGRANTLFDAARLAEKSIDSGAAASKLQDLIAKTAI